MSDEEGSPPSAGRARRVTGDELEAIEAAERARQARLGPKAPVLTPEERIAAHRRLLAEIGKAQTRREELEQERQRARLKLEQVEEFEGRPPFTAKDLVDQMNARRLVKTLERDVARASVAISQLARDIDATKAAHDDACEELFGMTALAAFAERADSATQEELAEMMREHDALFAHDQVGTFWSRQPKTLSPRERLLLGSAEHKEVTAKMRARRGLQQREEERLRLIWAQTTAVERVKLEQQMDVERAADNAAFLERFGERPTP